MPNYHHHHKHDHDVHNEVNVANHEHCKNHHDFKHMKTKNRNILAVIMVVTLVFAVVELIGGIWSGSLALISDFFHMITDSAAIFIALIMATISHRPANNNYSFGHGRSETIGALVNGLFMIGVIGYLIFEGIHRIINPEPVKSEAIIIISIGGLLVNAFALYMLKDSHSLNTRAAFIHVIGDFFGSVAALVAGIIIYYTGMTIFDPIISLLVSVILIMPTYKLIKESFHILMEGVPENINYTKVGNSINDVKGVLSTHDLHIWAMTSEHISLSAHVTIEKVEEWDEILSAIQIMLSEEYDINHVTLQPELKKSTTPIT